LAAQVSQGEDTDNAFASSPGNSSTGTIAALFRIMTVLVSYFSHTGHTKLIADAIAELCQADVERIEEVKPRKGVLGYFTAGRDAWRKRASEIRPVERDPATYDLVVVGTPVWAWNLSPAVRTYLTAHGDRVTRIAFFCTQGGSGAEGVFKQMQELCGQRPVATLAIAEGEVKKNDYAAKVRSFVESLA
jgi:flavodoxin